MVNFSLFLAVCGITSSKKLVLYWCILAILVNAMGGYHKVIHLYNTCFFVASDILSFELIHTTRLANGLIPMACSYKDTVDTSMLLMKLFSETSLVLTWSEFKIT